MTRINVCLWADTDDPHGLYAFIQQYLSAKDRRGRSRQSRPLFTPAWVCIGFSKHGDEAKQIAAVIEALKVRFAGSEARENWMYVLLVDADGQCTWAQNPFKHLDALVPRWRASLDETAERATA